MATIFTRFPPWTEAVLLVLAGALGFVFPDYAFALDHAPTSYVCVDTSKAECRETIIPTAIVLARNRATATERVDNPYHENESSATARDRARASGRWLN